MKRKIIRIDEAKCDGCGICAEACAEGAIKIVDGKAKLVSESYCDGLGACIGECPRGAIAIEEREAEAFDEEAVKKHLSGAKHAPESHTVSNLGKGHSHGATCPGMKSFSFAPKKGRQSVKSDSDANEESELSNWPIQLHLAPVSAPYWKGAEILLAADCTAFSFRAFHSKFLADKKLLIACPKLDDSGTYVEKLASIISQNDVKGITALRMEVPCCGGIANFAREARNISGKEIPLKIIIVGINGEIKSETNE